MTEEIKALKEEHAQLKKENEELRGVIKNTARIAGKLKKYIEEAQNPTPERRICPYCFGKIYDEHAYICLNCLLR